MNLESTPKYCPINGVNSFEATKEFNEYFLIKGKNVYKVMISKNKEEILISIQNYEIKMNNKDLSILLNNKFNTIDAAYFFIIDIFEEEKVIIQEKKAKILIKLLFILNIENKKKEIEIFLKYNNIYNNEINKKENNEFALLENDIKNIKNDIKILKEKIDKIEFSNNDNNIKNYKDNKYNNNLNLQNKIENKYNNIILNKSFNPKDIQFLKDVSNDSYSNWDLDNTFTVFNSINNILFLIYSNRYNSLISYNLSENRKNKEIQNAHENAITNCRHYLDLFFKRDLIMSISGEYNNIKVWNVNNNLELLINIENINSEGAISSACFLNDNRQNLILTSDSDGNPEPIKVFDFKGCKIKEIKESKEQTFFIDTYYDIKFNKIYILTGNNGFIKAYDYNNNEVKNKYCGNSKSYHNSIFVNDYDLILKIIESSEDGNIRIWNFNSGELINKINVSDKSLFGICLWDKDYLFIGCADNTIKLIDLNKNKIINNLKGHDNKVVTIKKINHPKYGKCLLSQGYENEKIKLWSIKDKNKS